MPTNDASAQTTAFPGTTKIPIRAGSRNFTPSIKSALSSASSQAGITSEQSRRAFQVTSEVFYGMKYYLSADDVQNVSVQDDTRSEYIVCKL